MNNINGTLISGIIAIMLLFLMASCDDDAIQPDPVDFIYDFEDGTEGWTAGFSDYPSGEEAEYNLEFEHTGLPAPLNQNEGALLLAGKNLSGDLFMYVKKRVLDLKPSTTYTATFTVVFATGMPGQTGGGPLESAWVKAGASPVEPLSVPDELNYYQMNIDIGNQSVSGADMAVLGSFARETANQEFVLRTLYNQSQFLARTNEKGELWFIVGLDSGVENNNRIYINTVRVLLE